MKMYEFCLNFTEMCSLHLNWQYSLTGLDYDLYRQQAFMMANFPTHICITWPQWVNEVKGLRPILEGLVTIQEGAWERGSQTTRPPGRGIWPSVRTSSRVLWQQTRQIGLNPDYNMTFSISTLNVSILKQKGEYGTQSESRFTCCSHCYVMWCSLTMGIVASQFSSSRDTLILTPFLKPLTLACLNAID